ncbi:MAG: cadmium-translocating P-type ATPase [Proteobacteria bacterium]|nr:cadmium-translocating P-type ATPase [Pseudomonadota bacterium]
MTALARQAGQSALETTVLVVPGMHCAGCMAKVERGLGGVSGVASARVNLTARQVRVEHDPAVAMPVLIDALSAAGFASQPRGQELTPPSSAAKPLLAPLAVAGFACMNVMLLSVSIWSGADGSTRDLFHWLSAGIGVPAIIYAGMPFFRSAWGAVKRGSTNMDVPISIGVILATGLSLYETVRGAPEAWFDGTLMLLLFLLAGRALDAAMRDRARAGVDALLRQAAPGAMVVTRGELSWLAAPDLLAGMIMRVAAGERLAADGEVISGASWFDQSLLTGESAPVRAATGDRVLAGTLNLENPVDVRVEAAGQGTTLAEIARLMDASGQTRSAYVRIADRASRLYAPAVHSLAALTFIGWMLAGAGFYQALVHAIAVLIITCPCALGLAVPVAQVVACGALMKRGIMVKDGSALERIATVDRALLDKTGTLTMGSPLPDPAVLEALPADAAAVAVGLASHSRHPLSRALVEALAARGVRPADLADVSEEAGQGLRALWQGRVVALRRPEAASGIAAVLEIAGQPTWLIPFADRLRPATGAALAGLRALGVEPSILSGDNAAAVAEVAQATGLTGQSAALPQDKQAEIVRLQAAGHKVLMVGDGLNDGPALAAANASIAPGTASDVGRQAADLVFLGDSLDAIPCAIRAARRTMRVVRENFVLAIGYNVLAVPLAMAGYVTPLVAAIAMSTSSLIVIGNSLRLAGAAR